MASLRPRIARMAATNAQQARQLHMTGPATFPSPLLTTERATAGGVPRDLAALRSECRQRNLPTTGSKAELTARLTAAAVTSSPASSGRHFNTSRAHKAVKDSSTMDFAYLPDFDPDTDNTPTPMGVPIIDSFGSRTRTGGVGAAEEIDETIMRQEVHIPEGSPSHVMPATPLVHAVNIPYEVHEAAPSNAGSELHMVAVASRIADAARRNFDPRVAPDESVAGSARKVWGGFLDDLLGEKKPAV